MVSKGTQRKKAKRDPSLRAKAEGQLAQNTSAFPEIKEKTPDELIHELRVHQIELEMQNEELKRAQLALEEMRDKYMGLYDFAPIGYFTFTREALIKEINLTGALLLGIERKKLINGRFRQFIVPEDFEKWDRHIISMFKQGDKQRCELSLKREGGSTFNALFESIRLDAGDGTFVVRTAVSDITERKCMEAEQQHTLKSLKDINHELALLYKVSSVLSRTIDMKELFDIVLNTVAGLNDLNIERKGGIFLVQDGAMRLISYLGHSEEFLNLHRDMKVGECLCGQAVLTGEVIISKNCNTDSSHTIRYPGMTLHGHVVLPLKAHDKVMGVLYLYLPADIDMDEDKINLLRYISNQIGLALDNARLYEETKKLSLQDPLTGLANRRLMDIIIERNIAVAKRHDIPFSALMIDIDHFKKYNDSFGHTAGDKLLQEVAGIISEELRGGVDFAVRYGGEEFLVLLSEIDSVKACDVAERLRKTVQDRTEVTVSLGISTYDGVKKETLIQRADEALYRAKQKGRNKVEVAGGPT